MNTLYPRHTIVPVSPWFLSADAHRPLSAEKLFEDPAGMAARAVVAQSGRAPDC